ncbi:hypothetical protein [Moraxella ovis]|uniref:hypothetical protein n=1 Tax=Moraxella ovis TaxID=29433 RepID=UPI000DA02F7E|nr:hypothetical protein [Moraxella ovis]SPX84574.1 Uncharacterised protein [Moraxella ovis]STZ05028.1 Uncharacterised protein [Moraxella ovis]
MSVIMEDIFEVVIKAIIKLLRTFGGIFQFFIEVFGDLISHLIEKCYKKYPKTIIFICILLLSVVIYALVMTFAR